MSATDEPALPTADRQAPATGMEAAAGRAAAARAPRARLPDRLILVSGRYAHAYREADAAVDWLAKNGAGGDPLERRRQAVTLLFHAFAATALRPRTRSGSRTRVSASGRRCPT